MLVRLTHAWTDPYGMAHGVGELVDIDAVTLAELEELGVVETMPDEKPDHWVNPTGTDPTAVTPDHWVNPTGEDPEAEADHWVNPTGTDPEEDKV